MTGPSDFTLFLGRFHPLLVHLPIGLIILLAALEVLAIFPRFKSATSSTGVIVALAAPLSIVTVVLGWLLSLAGGYDQQLLGWHKWSGVGTAAACLIAALLFGLNCRKSYRLCLALTLIALTVASHFGGSLTHGSDYLVRYAPQPLRAWLAPSSKQPVVVTTKTDNPLAKPAFSALVQPILDDKCVACHGPEKSKGGLRLDSFEVTMKGGDNGPALVPGKQAESEIIRRARLPEEHEDHMPPEGKPQLANEDLALLAWWIEAGASGQQTIAELKPAARIGEIVAARLGTSAPAVTVEEKTVQPKPLNEVLAQAESLGGELMIPLTALSQTESWLQANASIAGAAFGDEQLAKLVPIGANLRWLDLAGTKVTDTGLAHLAAMPNLTRLHLERTTVTDAGLSRLTCLANLEYLNLYGTPVTDAGLEHLKALPNLKQIYLWQSKVSPEAAKAFVEARTDKDQLQHWQEEIEKLQAKIRNSKIVVDVGTMIASASATNAGPVNKECPVTGKPVDATKTVLYEESSVAFCCDDCKAKFQQDSKPFLAKLQLPSKPDSTTAEAKPVNTKCPVSGKDVDASKTVIHEGKLIAFCCDNCKAKFEQDPKPFLEKLASPAPQTEAKAN